MFCLSVAMYNDVVLQFQYILGILRGSDPSFFWKMSWEQTKPKGKLQEAVSTEGTVEGSEQGWSPGQGTIDQYPWQASNLVKMWECANS